MALSITQAAGFPVEAAGTSQATVAVTTKLVDDLMVLWVKISSSSAATVASVAGGGVTTWTNAAAYTDNNYGTRLECWVGVVTSIVTSTNITATYSGTPGVACELAATELTTGGGYDPADVIWTTSGGNGIDDISSGTVTFPSVTTPSTGDAQAYSGYARCGQTPSAGSTAGFSYTVTGAGNLMAFNGTAANATAYQPTAPQSPNGAAAACGLAITATLRPGWIAVQGTQFASNPAITARRHSMSPSVPLNRGACSPSPSN